MKKDRLLVLLFYSFIVLLLISCAQKEIKNIDSKGTNIICFGNSITFGYGVSPGEDYPTVLSNMVNTPVINAGVDGDTSTGALQRIQSDVLDKDPLLVIIEFGGNDFLKRIPLEETLKNIVEMVKRIQSAGAMVAIADVSAGVIMSNYRKEYMHLSKKYNTIFMPHLLSGIFTDASLKSDFIHPNASGYKMIAQRIYRTIMPYLKQNALRRKSLP
jgi:lysophospholipase L1-like esterase